MRKSSASQRNLSRFQDMTSSSNARALLPSPLSLNARDQATVREYVTRSGKAGVSCDATAKSAVHPLAEVVQREQLWRPVRETQ